MTIQHGSCFEENKLIIADKSKKIIVFGTTTLAMMAVRIIKKLGNEVVCFCDNNKDKQGTYIEDIEVKHPDFIKEMSISDCLIFICAVREKAREEIKAQINRMGEYVCLDREFIEYCYQTEILNRQMDNVAFENNITCKKADNPLYIEKAISISVTQRCTLNCEKCVSYTPYLPGKRDRDTQEILSSLNKLTEAVDFIESISLVGGEALIHPDIVYICREAAKNPKIGYIRVITNGNTKPNAEIYGSISQYVSEINLSDYGVNSKYKEEVKAMCKAYGIIYSSKEFNNDKWLDLGDFHNRNYEIEKLSKMTKECFFTYNCLSMKNSKLYWCGRTGLLSELAGISEYDSDYVNLTLNKDELRQAIANFLTETKYLYTCNHCGLLENKFVDAGIQAKGILKLEEEYGEA